MKTFKDLSSLYKSKDGACLHYVYDMEVGVTTDTAFNYKGIIVPMCEKFAENIGVIIVPKEFIIGLSQSEFFLAVQYYATVLQRMEVNEELDLETTRYLETRATWLLQGFPGLKKCIPKLFDVREACIKQNARKLQKRKLLEELSLIRKSVETLLQII